MTDEELERLKLAAERAAQREDDAGGHGDYVCAVVPGKLLALIAEVERLREDVRALERLGREESEHTESQLSCAYLDRDLAHEERDSSRKEVERLREELVARDACWHCKDCLVPQVPRCEMCPSECDDENCQAEGCQK